LLQAASHAAAGQQYPKGALYLVATPIGNLADLTLRAIHVLALSDIVACEDTRVTARLLQHLGLEKRLMSVHQHNEAGSASDIIDALQQRLRVVYVSDAGTPAVSDPGAHLVAQVQAVGLRAVPIPGVSSATTALSVSGDTLSAAFHFAGFLPAKGAQRAHALDAALARIGPWSITALLATLVLLFAFQGQAIIDQPLVIAMLAVPILIQVLFNSALAYLLNRRLGESHNVACPSALIGASNFFELAVAAAISLFGFQSGAALATVVGVLIEVPVMLLVVRVVNQSKAWYEAKA